VGVFLFLLLLLLFVCLLFLLQCNVGCERNGDFVIVVVVLLVVVIIREEEEPAAAAAGQLANKTLDLLLLFLELLPAYLLVVV
jgi:hypothetical protein